MFGFFFFFNGTYLCGIGYHHNSPLKDSDVGLGTITVCPYLYNPSQEWPVCPYLWFFRVMGPLNNTPTMMMLKSVIGGGCMTPPRSIVRFELLPSQFCPFLKGVFWEEIEWFGFIKFQLFLLFRDVDLGTIIFRFVYVCLREKGPKWQWGSVKRPKNYFIWNKVCSWTRHHLYLYIPCISTTSCMFFFFWVARMTSCWAGVIMRNIGKPPLVNVTMSKYNVNYVR